MHDSHPGLIFIAVIIGVALVFTVLVVFVAVRVQRPRNAGPLQDQWHQARAALTFRQRRALWRATVPAGTTALYNRRPAQQLRASAGRLPVPASAGRARLRRRRRPARW